MQSARTASGRVSERARNSSGTSTEKSPAGPALAVVAPTGRGPTRRSQTTEDAQKLQAGSGCGPPRTSPPGEPPAAVKRATASTPASPRVAKAASRRGSLRRSGVSDSPAPSGFGSEGAGPDWDGSAGSAMVRELQALKGQRASAGGAAAPRSHAATPRRTRAVAPKCNVLGRTAAAAGAPAAARSGLGRPATVPSATAVPATAASAAQPPRGAPLQRGTPVDTADGAGGASALPTSSRPLPSGAAARRDPKSVAEPSSAPATEQQGTAAAVLEPSAAAAKPASGSAAEARPTDATLGPSAAAVPAPPGTAVAVPASVPKPPQSGGAARPWSSRFQSAPRRPKVTRSAAAGAAAGAGTRHGGTEVPPGGSDTGTDPAGGAAAAQVAKRTAAKGTVAAATPASISDDIAGKSQAQLARTAGEPGVKAVALPKPAEKPLASTAHAGGLTKEFQGQAGSAGAGLRPVVGAAAGHQGGGENEATVDGAAGGDKHAIAQRSAAPGTVAAARQATADRSRVGSGSATPDMMAAGREALRRLEPFRRASENELAQAEAPVDLPHDRQPSASAVRASDATPARVAPPRGAAAAGDGSSHDKTHAGAAERPDTRGAALLRGEKGLLDNATGGVSKGSQAATRVEVASQGPQRPSGVGASGEERSQRGREPGRGHARSDAGRSVGAGRDEQLGSAGALQHPAVAALE